MIPLLLWLLALQLLQTGTSAQQERNGVVGGSVTLLLDVPAEWHITSVVWTSNVPIATVTAGGSEDPHIITVTQRYKGRLSVSTDYSLTISNLSLEDTGTYRADVHTADTTTTTTSQFSLHVYELLGEPSVTVKSTASDKGVCTVTLTCSMAGEMDNMTLSWTPLGPETTESPDGSILSITRRSGDPQQDYTCTATNPVSDNSHAVSADQILCLEILLFPIHSMERALTKTQSSDLLNHPANPEGGEHPQSLNPLT
ncbi:SLAM family member 5-like isoform X2 [Tachyglossus aculeatus]|uniref:SLAM family member 5-like isoform X2 n=1 Tax=Tachyglossus aculeatus TaxID=9261 RepID=UPI0018F2B00A|nr:SLAM family member 5-like isoform X2 [Tachyglossus aculeatus]